jgi:hypothetical protein
MSGVFQNIDPSPPSPPVECAGGGHTSWVERGWEVKDARYISVLYICKYFGVLVITTAPPPPPKVCPEGFCPHFLSEACYFPPTHPGRIGIRLALGCAVVTAAGQWTLPTCSAIRFLLRYPSFAPLSVFCSAICLLLRYPSFAPLSVFCTAIRLLLRYPSFAQPLCSWHPCIRRFPVSGWAQCSSPDIDSSWVCP